MKGLEIKKLQRVEVPAEEQFDNIVAFQLVQFTYGFYGNEIIDVLDTKIMKDGSQFVIDGNGFIKEGFQVA